MTIIIILAITISSAPAATIVCQLQGGVANESVWRSIVLDLYILVVRCVAILGRLTGVELMNVYICKNCEQNHGEIAVYISAVDNDLYCRHYQFKRPARLAHDSLANTELTLEEINDVYAMLQQRGFRRVVLSRKSFEENSESAGPHIEHRLSD